MVLQVALGLDYGCARFDDGSVQCWGSNENGQTGRDVDDTATPGIVPGVGGVLQVAIGQATVVRLFDGTVWGWGYNDAGELGLRNYGGVDPARIDEIPLAEQVSTSIQTCGLSGDEITCVGLPLGEVAGTKAQVQRFDGHGVRALAGGCLLMDDRSLKCWGANSHGEVGVGDEHPRLAPTAVPGLTEVVEVAVGGQFTCALRQNGSAYCWGTNWAGQLGTGDTAELHRPDRPVVSVPRLKRIAAGADHVCGIGDDAFVYCWGDDGADQLGFRQRTYRPSPIPRRVEGLSEINGISAGAEATCAIKADHTVWCWGENGSVGALGAGSKIGVSATPLEVRFATER